MKTNKREGQAVCYLTALANGTKLTGEEKDLETIEKGK